MTSKWAVSALRILFVLLALSLAVRTLQNPHPTFCGAGDTFVFSEGNAPEPDRSEIVDQLKLFQEGYAARDTSRVDSFARQLLSDEILILGTMPQEIYRGFDEARELVRTDWESWGDCTFLVEQARISTHDNVAWVSTIGEVQFDLSRFLVMPLRLTGVMANEEGTWRFRQLQFQFDLDLSFLLLLILVLIVWLVAEVMVLLVRGGLALSRAGRGRGHASG